MKRFLLYASQTGRTLQLVDAVRASVAQLADDLQFNCLPAEQATLDDLLATDGIVLATPENFGYMAGKLKDFFDRTYYPAQGRTEGLACLLLVSAGNDGMGHCTPCGASSPAMAGTKCCHRGGTRRARCRASGRSGGTGRATGGRHADRALVIPCPEELVLTENGTPARMGRRCKKGDAPTARMAFPVVGLHAVGVGATGNQVFQCISLDQLDVLDPHSASLVAGTWTAYG
jgi:hypothetical protein